VTENMIRETPRTCGRRTKRRLWRHKQSALVETPRLPLVRLLPVGEVTGHQPNNAERIEFNFKDQALAIP